MSKNTSIKISGQNNFPSVISSNTTFYVNTTVGSDTVGDGTSNSPWQTVSKALNFLLQKWIDNDVVVTIQIQDIIYQTYIYGPIQITHSQGYQINILNSDGSIPSIEYMPQSNYSFPKWNGYNPYAAWSRACRLAITVPSTVSQALSYFPVLITPACLPTELTNNTYGRSDGGDLIFCTDLGLGNTVSSIGNRLPCEMVTCTFGASPSAEIWVQIPNIYPVGTTTYIWVLYGNSAQTSQPAASSTYGSQMVWKENGTQNYVAVYHFGGTSSLTCNDSTSNTYNGTNNGCTVASSSITGTAASFAPSGTSGYIWINCGSLPIGTKMTYQAWTNFAGQGASGTCYYSYNRIIESNYLTAYYLGLQANGNTSYYLISNNTSAPSSTAAVVGQWTFIAATYDGTNGTIYKNGAIITGPTSLTAPSPQTLTTYIGRNPTNASDVSNWNGLMDEVRISAIDRPVYWLAAEYANQIGPASFISPANMPISTINPFNQITQAFKVRQNIYPVNQSPTISTFGSVGSATGKWIGGVLSANGNIYGIPYTATSVLVINTNNNTATTLGGGLTANPGWAGGALAQNGNIYCAEQSSSNVLIINPNTGALSTIGNVSSAYGWVGAYTAFNGNMYCVPQFASSVLVINPNTGTVTTLGSGLYAASGASSSAWLGGVLAPNGNIYGIPSSAVNVLVINPTAGTATTIGSGLSGGWCGGVLAPNGKIYCIPQNASTVLVIDPVAGTTSTFGSFSALSGQWSCGAMAPNGIIYCIPWNGTSVLAINTNNNTVSTIATGLSGGWYGGVLAPNGCIYGIPINATSILCINTGMPVPADFCLSPYYNKF